MAVTVVVLAASNAVVTGVALLVAADPTGTVAGSGQTVTVEIIGALAVILVAVIGVIGNYLGNRRTAPSPPGPDMAAHDVAVHDRVTINEANLSDLRREVAQLREHIETIDARVIPLRDVMDAKFADVYRRLDKLEERL